MGKQKEQQELSNIGFFKKGKILPRASTLKNLLTADACTLKITNQKNGRMGETIHQHATKTNFCPVKATARRIHHIISNKGKDDNLICDYYNNKTNTWKQISQTDMIQYLREAVANLDLTQAGITFSQSWRSNGPKTQWSIRHNNNENGKMGLPNFPPIHTQSNSTPKQRHLSPNEQKP